MAEPHVFIIHLRRPRSASAHPDERRDDPFYEFGSFGCTGCHSHTLFHPRRAHELEGARLAFAQGGPLGLRMVFLTPPVTVRVWSDRCEARWAPAEMPFKYTDAPILALNGERGDFPLVDQFARDTNRTTAEGRLSSRLRSLAKPLSIKMAREVIAIYERKRLKAARGIASTYDEALPWSPPMVDRTREATYRSHITQLSDDAADLLNDEVESKDQPSCCLSRRRKPKSQTRRCP